jgi:hypothetical protein
MFGLVIGVVIGLIIAGCAHLATRKSAVVQARQQVQHNYAPLHPQQYPMFPTYPVNNGGVAYYPGFHGQQ